MNKTVVIDVVVHDERSVDESNVKLGKQASLTLTDLEVKHIHWDALVAGLVDDVMAELGLSA